MPFTILKTLAGLTSVIGLGILIFFQIGRAPSPDPVHKPSRVKNPSESADMISNQHQVPTTERKAVGKESEFDLGQFMARMLDARKIEDVTRRALACKKIIEEMCLMGYPEQAWKLIDQDPGRVRNFELSGYFASRNVSEDKLRAKIADLPAFEAGFAVSSWLGKLSLDELKGALLNNQQGDSLYLIRTSNPAAFSQSLGGYFQKHLNFGDPAEKTRILESIAEFSDKNLLDSRGIATSLQGVKFDSPFSQWEYLISFSKDRDVSTDLDPLRSKAIAAMIQNDAKQAMDVLLPTPGIPGVRDLQLAVREWAAVDSKGASEWYQQNAASLSDEKQSAVAAGIFARAVEMGDYDGARQWAEQIKKPELRKQANAMIDLEISKSVK